MELSASWVCRLWIFSVFLWGDCTTGWSGLQGEGEPKLLHRPEQRMFWVHQKKNGVLLWYILSENQRLLWGLSACVPNIWWVARFTLFTEMWHYMILKLLKFWKLKVWGKLTSIPNPSVSCSVTPVVHCCPVWGRGGWQWGDTETVRHTTHSCL